MKLGFVLIYMMLFWILFVLLEPNKYWGEVESTYKLAPDKLSGETDSFLDELMKYSPASSL
jgi:hypothetical protein